MSLLVSRVLSLRGSQRVGGERALQGHVVAFELDASLVSAAVTHLPRSVDTLSDMISVVFSGPIRSAERLRPLNAFSARIEVVIRAFEWLKMSSKLSCPSFTPCRPSNAISSDGREGKEAHAHTGDPRGREAAVTSQ